MLAGEPGLVELLQVRGAFSAEPVREAEPGEGWAGGDHPGLPQKVLGFLFSLAIVALAESMRRVIVAASDGPRLFPVCLSLRRACRHWLAVAVRWRLKTVRNSCIPRTAPQDVLVRITFLHLRFVPSSDRNLNSSKVSLLTFSLKPVGAVGIRNFNSSKVSLLTFPLGSIGPVNTSPITP